MVDWISMIQAAIMGIVEGLTEFLPVSSTGHLILTSSLLGLEGEFWHSFDMAIQFGAIIAVIWEFRARILKVINGMWQRNSTDWRFAVNVIVACIPASFLALLFEKQIKGFLFNAVSVAIALIVGGLIILWAERRQTPESVRVHSMDDMSILDALKVGIAQIAALFPGTSRSGSTIIGGMLFGLSRQTATQFSFFLAIPILFAASAKELLSMGDMLTSHNLTLFAIGFIFSFVSAFFCVRWLLRFVSQHNFNGFAWYRIVFGVIILVTWALGWVDWTQAG